MANNVLAMVGGITLAILGVIAATSLLVLAVQAGRAIAHWLTDSKPVG